MQRSSSLTVGEKVCAVFIPLFAIIDILFSTIGQCFDCRRRRSPQVCHHVDLARLAHGSPCVCFIFSPPLLINGFSVLTVWELKSF